MSVERKIFFHNPWEEEKEKKKSTENTSTFHRMLLKN
jgi:hypothetical protein